MSAASHITLLQVENFKRLSAVTLRLNGPGVVEIRGRNGQGKTSVVDSVISAFGGAKWAPAKPIRDGAGWAQVLVETSGATPYRITRRWWERDGEKDGDKLVVEDLTTGAEKRSPQALLDKLAGAQQFDPLRFLRAKPKDQAALLRELTGLDTAALDAERETVYALRTSANRDVAALKGKLDGLTEPIPRPPAPPEQDITPLLTEIEAAGKLQAKNDLARRELEVIRKRIQELQVEMAALLARERAGIAHVATLVDPDVAAIKARAEDVKAHNARARVARDMKADSDRAIDAYASLRQSFTEADRVAAAHTVRIKEIDAARLALLAAVTMPVPGLAVDGDTVTLDGLPFSQASQSQQIRTCFAIAAALSGELRTAFSHEGSLLDDQARADLDVWAVENNVQILLEVVGDGPGGIVIEDGRVAAQAAGPGVDPVDDILEQARTAVADARAQARIETPY